MNFPALLHRIARSFRGAMGSELRPRPRLHVLPSTLHELQTAVSPQIGRGEPLALLWARYASEENRHVIVGVKVEPFDDKAYVDGPDGANFDVNWLMGALEVAARSNAGALLCHEHAHMGEPSFSRVDAHTNKAVMAKQRYVNDALPYGALVLSLDDAHAVVGTGHSMCAVDVKVMPEYRGGSAAV